MTDRLRWVWFVLLVVVSTVGALILFAQSLKSSTVRDITPATVAPAVRFRP